MHAAQPGLVQKARLGLQDRVHVPPGRLVERRRDLRLGIDECARPGGDRAAEVGGVQVAARLLDDVAVEDARRLGDAAGPRTGRKGFGHEPLGVLDAVKLVESADRVGANARQPGLVAKARLCAQAGIGVAPAILIEWNRQMQFRVDESLGHGMSPSVG